MNVMSVKTFHGLKSVEYLNLHLKPNKNYYKIRLGH